MRKFGVWELTKEKVYKKHDEDYWIKVTEENGILAVTHDPVKSPQYAWHKADNESIDWIERIWISHEDVASVTFYRYLYIRDGIPEILHSYKEWDIYEDDYMWRGHEITLLEAKVIANFLVPKELLEGVSDKHLSEYTSHGA